MRMNKSKQLVWKILSTPIDIGFREFRESTDNFWLTKEREILCIEDMETDYIIKCINMLEQIGQDQTAAYRGLTKELSRRYNNSKGWFYENKI